MMALESSDFTSASVFSFFSSEPCLPPRNQSKVRSTVLLSDLVQLLVQREKALNQIALLSIEP